MTETKNTEATALPWTVRTEPMNHNGPAQVGTGETLAAEVYGPTGEACRANAALIVRAVNSHERLVAALRLFFEAWEELADEPKRGGRQPGEVLAEAGFFTAARAALAAAEGREG